MKNSSFIFKMLSLIFLVLNSAFLIFFMISFLLVFTKVAILSKLHLIVLIVTIGINLIYVTYLAFVLIINRRRKMI